MSLDRAPWTAPQVQPAEPTYGNAAPPSAAPVAEREARVYDMPAQSTPMTEAPRAPATPLPPSTTPYVVGSAPLPTSQTSNMAVLALVFGILSWTFLPLIAGIGAVVTGHIARRELRNGNNTSGGGLALAGLILGYLNLFFLAIAGCAVLAVVFAAA